MFVAFQIFSCENKQIKSNNNNTLIKKDIQTDKKLKSFKIFDAGGPEYPPYLLLKIENTSATKYIYNNELILKDSIIISGKKFDDYANLLNNIPPEFFHGNGGNLTSPTDNSGFLFEMEFEDKTTYRWGIFQGDYQYSPEIKKFTKNLYKILE